VNHQHQDAADHRQHTGMSMNVFPAREGSGTSWLPDRTPMYGLQRQAGSWSLMGHGNVFGQYLDERGDRGSDQFGSINWMMGMARRDVGGGRLGVRGMFSLEPWTIRGCGYPDLLATGELCNGETIHDRQHQHDLFMELAAEYDHRLKGNVRWQVYAGLAGEPALGPVAYPHRLTAMPNPLAPIVHHWLDATHITFGVITAGVLGSRWKAEGSAFNGREPDENRKDLDLAALNSYSGRVSLLPTPNLAIQVSAGQLTEAEPAHDGDGRVDVDRATASVTYHRPLDAQGFWGMTVAWGHNAEGDESTHAFLLETSLTIRQRDTWFARFEVVQKPAHDLDVPVSTDRSDIFGVAKLQAGYTRYLPAVGGLQPGVGGSLSFSFVPESLEPFYGRRSNTGWGVYVTIRPAIHHM
jgi:hypothetical protein